MMPTLSTSGSAVDFAQSGRMFDPRTTPSQVGLLSEVFRRSPGVVRSIHPTHSVAAWGSDTDWWLRDHHLAETPCGRGTPFHRLLERNGKIALAGTGIPSMTFFHCAEELLESQMPFSPFTTERYVMTCRVNGQLMKTAPMRLYAAEVSRRRRLAPLETELRSKGRWHESRIGTLTVIVLPVAEVWRTLEEMSSRGIFVTESAMKLVEALQVANSPEQGPQFSAFLACGFTPLHLETAVKAHLRLALPGRTIEVKTGLYGDLAGTLETALAKADVIMVVIEWADLDPRLGWWSTGRCG